MKVNKETNLLIKIASGCFFSSNVHFSFLFDLLVCDVKSWVSRFMHVKKQLEQLQKSLHYKYLHHCHHHHSIRCQTVKKKNHKSNQKTLPVSHEWFSVVLCWACEQIFLSAEFKRKAIWKKNWNQTTPSVVKVQLHFIQDLLYYLF